MTDKTLPPSATGDALADWDDPKVQAVYAILCESGMPPNKEEHWEGYTARKIVAAISALSETGEKCRYAEDVGMPEHRCAVKCQYAASATRRAMVRWSLCDDGLNPDPEGQWVRWEDANESAR